MTNVDNIGKRCGVITSHSLYGRLSPMRVDKLHCGDLTDAVAVMLKGKTPLKVPPWTRGDGLGLGVVVCGQVTLWGLSGSVSCDA